MSFYQKNIFCYMWYFFSNLRHIKYVWILNILFQTLFDDYTICFLDAESISIFLKLCSQMIIFMKKSSNSVFGEFQFGSEDFEKSLITIERLCSILKSLNVITIVKCLQEFIAVFDNILEIREISELSKFNVSVSIFSTRTLLYIKGITNFIFFLGHKYSWWFMQILYK